MNTLRPSASSPDAPAHRSRRRLAVNLEDDPVALLVNFFDVSIVFALGFMVAWMAQARPAAEACAAAATAAARSGNVALPAPALRLERFRETNEPAGGEGERLGTAYRLASGEVVYVPDAPK